MTLGFAALWRAGAFACMGLAALAGPARSASGAASPATVVDLRALSSAGASAAAPAGWTLAANANGSDIRLRSADGALGAEWGLYAVAVPTEHLCNGAPDISAKPLLVRTLHAMGDDGNPVETGAPRAYTDYFTGCPFETPSHRGILFYHQYQWDENQTVISYYVAWTDKDHWSSSGFVAVNVAFSIRAARVQSSLNPFWADGKQAEAEEGLRVVGDAYNRDAHVLRLPSKTSLASDMLCLDAAPKPGRVETRAARQFMTARY